MYKAFALTGRLADCHHTQGDALGYGEVAPPGRTANNNNDKEEQ